MMRLSEQPHEQDRIMRTISGVALIILGAIYAAMCFFAVAMMSRSVDMFTEAFLPSLLALAPIGLGAWLVFKR
jgi:hypothetical protein